MKKNHLYTLGSLIILLICAFVFVILPAFTGAGTKQEKIPAFGKYNGKEIRYEQGTDFANFVSQYGQMFQSYGYQMDSSTYYQVFDYAFKATLTRMAYSDAVAKSGYQVPKSAVNREMLPYFYDENGKYSSKIYKQTPAATVATIRQDVESSLFSGRFYDDNFASQTDMFDSLALYGIKHSDAELDFLSAYAESKRGFNMAVFPMSTYPNEQKVAYGKANPDKFNKYDLSVITVSDKTTANTIAKRLNNAEITFTDAISEYSEKNYSNTEGKMTYKYQYQIENILANKEDMSLISGLEFDAVSDIVQTANGYSLFRCDAPTIAPDFENSDLVAAIGSYLSVYENTIIEDYFTARAKDFSTAAKNTDFVNACAQFNISNVVIEPFPLNYGSTSITTQTLDTSLTGLANADTNDNFLKTAFGLKLNEISAPIVLNNNIVVLQFTTEETANAEEEAMLTDLQTYDEATAQNALLSNPKFENNFASVYFEYIMNNNQDKLQISNNTKPCLAQTPQGFSVSYNERFLYSKYAPSKTILQTIENLELATGTLILCNSPALPYGLSELSAKLPENCYMLLCEADAALYEFECNNENSTQLPQNAARLTMEELQQLPFILQKTSYTFSDGNTLPPAGTFRRVIRVDFSAGVQFHLEYYEQVFQAAVASIKTYWVNRVTLARFGRRYSKNFFSNLKKLSETAPIQNYFGQIEKPILVLGAGESLNKTLSDLTTADKNSLCILCADTALQPCLKHGIVPDGVFIEEAQAVIAKAFIGALRKDIHIFAGLSSLPLLTKLFPAGQISYFTTLYTNAAFIDGLASQNLLPPQNQPMGSVGLTAVYYALKFRKSTTVPVLVSGLDFSYSPGITHAKGTLAHTQRLLSSTRLQPVQNYTAAFTTATTPFTDKAGNKMITTPTLQGYANLFNNLFSQEENLYDIGESGITINIPKSTLCSFKNQDLSSNTTNSISSKPDFNFSKTKNDIQSISSKALKTYFESEHQTLLTLRDILSGKQKLNPQEQQEKIKQLAIPREYLYLHFPDGHTFSYTSAFLNRLRAEIDFFLKYI